MRIQSIDVKGGKELGAALSRLGVRLVKGSADLTVTLVNDYLEAQLAELNRQHLADRTSWLLVQPSGIFPLVGPVFSPGKSACWACLADRMNRNREVKALLDRGQARCVAVSPLARNPFGQSAIQLAAVEIAKAIATEFRTDLRDHVISLDLLGSTIVRHYVAARPQCPSCGRKKLRDPRRAPVPIELAAGTKLVMTSGGYRTVSSRATVARFRKHVSPLTGVVSRLERIDVDLPLNTNYYAGHNFSAPAESVDELRAGLSGGSFGKGSTAEQGEASALMEAIERYSGIFQGDEIRVTRRFTDFPPGDAILPNDVLLFSDAQYRADQEPTGVEGTPTPEPFDRSAEVEWSPVWSLRDERFKYLPTSLLYFFYRGGPTTGQVHADSNGCAAGNTLEEAIVQGFLELVERDSYAIWWYNRLQRAEVDLAQCDDSYVRDLQIQLAETGRRLWVIDITSDLGIPSFVAMSHAKQDSHDFVEYGSGSHFDARIALLRSLTELNQFLSIGLMGARNAGSDDGSGPFRLADHPYLTPNGNPAVRPDFGSKFGRLDRREQVMACVQTRQASGPRFPRPRSDAARHRGPGRQGDRSGIAALLPPLRPRPALRYPGKARMARATVVGNRAQSASSPHLRSSRLARSRNQSVGSGLRQQLFPPGSSATSPSKRRPSGEIVACFDGFSVGLGTFSAAAAERAEGLRTGLPLSSFAPDGRDVDKEIHLLVRRLAARGLLEYRLGPSRKGEAQLRPRSSSNRRFPIIGRACRRSAMPMFSSCRDSPTCGGAPTR